MTEDAEAVLADTNILLSTIRLDEPQHLQAQTALRRLREANRRIVDTPQIVAEFWNVATRPATSRGGLGMDVAEAQRTLKIFEAQFEALSDGHPANECWNERPRRPTRRHDDRSWHPKHPDFRRKRLRAVSRDQRLESGRYDLEAVTNLRV